MAGFVELFKSRRIVTNTAGVTVIRYYKAPKADVSAGAGGLTATGLPLVGDSCTWTSATWSLYVGAPVVEAVDLDPRSTAATAIVRVTAHADRLWVD